MSCWLVGSELIFVVNLGEVCWFMNYIEGIYYGIWWFWIVCWVCDGIVWIFGGCGRLVFGNRG